MPKICGVYCFIYTPDGRCYVGSSVDIEKRRRAHIHYARSGRTSIAFQDALIVLGEHNFDFEVLEECEAGNRLEREHFYIQFLDSVAHGFNVDSNPTQWGCAHKCSWSTRAKLSATAKSRTPENRARRSEISKALWQSEEYRAKATKPRPPRPPHGPISPEQKAKLSAAMKGRRKTAAHRMRISRAMRARHVQKLMLDIRRLSGVEVVPGVS